MRRRRAELGLSQAELADRVSALGGSMYQQTIAKIESGQRAVRLTEADVIAKALNTGVAEMLSDAIGAPNSSPQDMHIDELLSQLRAARRRLDGATAHLDDMREEEALARERLARAQQQADIATVKMQRALAAWTSIKADSDYLARISMQRQSELNARYGPRWQDVLRAQAITTRETGMPDRDEELIAANHAFLEKVLDYSKQKEELTDQERVEMESELAELRGRLDELKRQRRGDAGSDQG
ncbi:helix-turn-helix domain-containing protein [Streptomyces hydrogenans]|uniref:helix-turn-helix transcriptional regulator n=1 Tax=Streptomyces hydrogenans TaxID=1873719 RepID=UPI0036A0A33B